MDLDLGIISEVEKRQKKKLLLDYLYSNLKNHNFWAYRYFFCELLGLLNVIGECGVLTGFLLQPTHLFLAPILWSNLIEWKSSACFYIHPFILHLLCISMQWNLLIINVSL